jgi:uncharacterized membrane protein
MVPYQLKKENFIPLIVLLAGSALLFGFLALPYSHFDVLGLMQAMQTADSDSHLAALGSLTILLIVLIAGLFVIGVLALFTSKLYLLRIEIVFLLAVFGMELGCEAVYAGVGISALLGGKTYYSWINLINLIGAVVVFAAFLLTSILFVFKPMHALLLESSKRQEAETEKARAAYHQEVSGLNEEQMKDYLRKKLESGEISPSTYQEMINALNRKD